MHGQYVPTHVCVEVLFSTIGSLRTARRQRRRECRWTGADFVQCDCSSLSSQAYATRRRLTSMALRDEKLTFEVRVPKMPFRNYREAVALAHNLRIIDEELLLLFDINASKNPEFPYWKYEFDLESMSNDECMTEFRFFKNDIYMLAETLNLSEIFKCYNGVLVEPLKALCILLKQFSYPCRYGDMVATTGRPVPQLSMIANLVVDHLYNRYSYLLSDLNQPWLSPENLQSFAEAIHKKGATLDNCWGFIDGTMLLICRPGKNQRTM